VSGVSERAADRTSLGELALLFLRLGATAFGGPAAHVAMMHDEVVRRRAWMDEERFLDLVGATNLIPGPNSTELAIHIGWERRRFAGLIVAGVAFIVPAMLLTAACGWVYVRWGSVPSAHAVLRGIKPVVLGVIAQAIVGLAPKAARTTWLRLLGVAVAIASVLGAGELTVLFGAGAIAMLGALARRGPDRPQAPLAPVASIATGASIASGGALGAAASVTLPALFLVFLKIGSVLFGSGYVLVAFLRSELVERLGWLSEAQLLDAVAVGQVTPGPVFTTATFIGWILAGPEGALVATLGIFLPAFFFVAISGPFVPRIRNSRVASAFLDGVNVASLVLMALVTVGLARSTLIDVPSIALALGATLALLRYRINPTWLVLGGGAVGLVVELIHRMGTVS
jgi:chromate transporter